MKSGEYWVFLSGKSGREVHGVGVIIHSSLLQSILAVKAISSWLIMVHIKITGGRFTIFGAYSPHDGMSNVESRMSNVESGQKTP